MQALGASSIARSVTADSEAKYFVALFDYSPVGKSHTGSHTGSNLGSHTGSHTWSHTGHIQGHIRGHIWGHILGHIRGHMLIGNQTPFPPELIYTVTG